MKERTRKDCIKEWRGNARNNEERERDTSKTKRNKLFGVKDKL